MQRPDPTAPLNYANQGNIIVISGIALTVLAVFSSGLRFQTRIFYSKSFSWDDGFLVVAVTGVILTLAFNLLAVRYGYGRHVATLLVTGPDPAVALKYQIVSEATNMFAMMALKVSLGMSFVRLRLGERITWGIYVTVAIALLCNLCALIAILGQCRPMERAWNMGIPGNCWSNEVKTVTWYVQSAGNILSDLVFTIGPLVYLSKIKVSRYHRWALRGVFCLGLLATGCGIVKTVELRQLLLGGDPTWDTINLTVWYTAEIATGIFAASLPALKARFEALLFYMFHIKAGSGYRSGPLSHTGTAITRTGKSQTYIMDRELADLRNGTNRSQFRNDDWASDRQILHSSPQIFAEERRSS
ncbi:uncharacterized protein N7479_000122 [Penicillium vulpinum]|uniref:Rhodopsin domain-containing protein n=1 Tax=Penicillium vulpinum TaxID=29845 RepID=A0A1V6RWK1_9EURO|nr:uncharacterized protein N7479_000122 [Penicillium vulpinum]KAJ5970204.1 hypothetical protein N7479_000122 [Penicillium vulpinum]OQE06142.1 hypothetical protein PENVUL_c019G08175 [Penicillium vulpinum]